MIYAIEKTSSPEPTPSERNINMNFELTSTPPSADDIAAERVALTQTLATLKLRERWFHGAWLAVMVVSVAAIYAMLGVVAAVLTVTGAMSVGAVIVAASETTGEALTAWGLVAGAAAVAMAVTDGTDSSGATAMAATVVVTAAATVAYIRWVAVPRFGTTPTLDDLEILAQNRCPDVLAWCLSDPEVAAYRAAVAQQGRMLVEGEYAAMKRWHDGAATRKAQTEEQAACERLMQPVAVI